LSPPQKRVNSNQSNQPWIDVVNCLVRESTYVLDGLLYQDAPPIKEHYVDTGGFTELLFGLFMLLGFRFAPRLRDLSDQTLYRPRKHTDYGCVARNKLIWYCQEKKETRTHYDWANSVQMASFPGRHHSPVCAMVSSVCFELSRPGRDDD